MFMLAIFLTALLMPGRAGAAVSNLDQWGNNVCGSGAGTNFNVTCAALPVTAGSNRVMLVYAGGVQPTGDTAATITATYGGRTITMVPNGSSIPSGRRWSWVGYLLESDLATAGSGADLVVNYNGANSDMWVNWGVYSGVDQTGGATTFPSSGQAYGNATCSVALTHVLDGTSVFVASSTPGTFAYAQGTFINRWDVNPTNGSSYGMTRETTPAAAETVTVTSDQREGCVGLAMQPSAGDTLIASASLDLTVANPLEGDTGVDMLRFQVDSDNGDSSTVEVSGLNINDAGNATSLTAHVYISTVSQATLPGGAVLLGSTTAWDGAATTVSLTGGTVADRTVTNGTPKYIYIVYDIPGGQGTLTIQPTVTGVVVVSPDSGAAGLNYQTALRTVQSCVDATPSTLSIQVGQSINGDNYDPVGILTTTGNLGSLEYKVSTVAGGGAPFDEQEYFDTNNTTNDWSFWTAATSSNGTDPVPNGTLGSHADSTVDNGDGTHTPSAGTGPTSLHSGTHGASGGFLFIEASGTGPYAATFTRNAQFDADAYELNISFASAAYGANINSIRLEANDGTGWVTEWQQVGDDANNGTWTPVSLNLFAGGGLSAKAYNTGMVDLRFVWDVTSFAGDAAIDTIRVFGNARPTETFCSGDLATWATAPIPATAAGGSTCGDYTDAGTFTLYAEGTDPDCGTVIVASPVSETFTWNACTDPDPTTGVTINPPVVGSTVAGIYSVQATVAGEATPGGAGASASITIAGTTGGVCDVTGAAMTWNSGAARWEYAWDTTACGNPVESGITIDVSYTDGDCGTVTNAAQITAISVDNTCSDPDPAALSIDDPISSTTVTGGYLIQVGVTGEGTPGGMTGMSVTAAGTTACDITAVSMTWNSGSGQWEYIWDTTTCGDPVENPITIDVSGNDPDCGDLVSATQATNITVDNTGPVYTISGCTSCHAYPPADGTRDGATGAVVGSHQAHGAVAMACTTCHVDNAAATGHREGIIEMSGDVAAYKGGTFSHTNNPSPYEACANIACHGTSSPVWSDATGTTGDCSLCHGMSDGATYTDTAGHTGNTDPQVGAHEAHLAGQHAISSSIACGECHTEPAGTYAQKVNKGAGHNDTALPAEVPLGGTIATSGGLTPAYATKQCSSTWCHGAGLQDGGLVPTWDVPVLGVAGTGNCNDCHAYPPSAMAAWSLTHPVNTSCNDCHDNVAADGYTMVNAALHVDGSIDRNPCNKCHDKVMDAGDGVVTRRAVIPEFNGTVGHMKYAVSTAADATLVGDCGKCHTEQGTNHLNNALDTPRGALAVGATAYCLDCHKAGATNNDFAGDTAGAAADINTAWTATFNHANPNATGALECIACHGDGAGNARFHGGSATGLMKITDQKTTCFQAGCHGTGAAMDIQSEFDPAVSTGGTHPVLGAVTPKSTVLQADTTGDLFVNGWSKDSVATCSDCHGMSAAGPRGPHGSSYDYILLGADTTISTVTSGRAYGTPKNSAATTTNTQQNFCINCHASDVYGFGSNIDGLNPSQRALSAIVHYGTGGDETFRADRCGGIDGEGGRPGVINMLVGCTNCHAGGGRANGAHGSTYGVSAASNPGFGTNWTPSSTGFMDGNSWTQAPDDTACYAASPAAGWSTCAEGNHN